MTKNEIKTKSGTTDIARSNEPHTPANDSSRISKKASSKTERIQLSLIKEQQNRIINKKEIHPDLIQALFKTAQKQPMRALTCHKRIIAVFVTVGFTMCIIGINFCIRHIKLSGQVEESDISTTKNKLKLNANGSLMSNITEPDILQSKSHKKSKFPHVHDDLMKSANFCIFQILVSVGLMIVIISVVAYVVLKERVKDIQKHALERTWIEVIIPNTDNFKHVSDSYENVSKNLNGIPFKKMGLAELSKGDLPNAKPAANDHACYRHSKMSNK